MITIKGNPRDLGDGFHVSRILPNAARRTVGPFVFFDYFGPVEFAPGKGIDVRPHPHVGLATVTYLFEGSQMHRDTLGSAQEIHPGDVNWMTAGARHRALRADGTRNARSRSPYPRHSELDRSSHQRRRSCAIISKRCIARSAVLEPQRRDDEDHHRSSI
jgi:hypothetical protein